MIKPDTVLGLDLLSPLQIRENVAEEAIIDALVSDDLWVLRKEPLEVLKLLECRQLLNHLLALVITPFCGNEAEQRGMAGGGISYHRSFRTRLFLI